MLPAVWVSRRRRLAVLGAALVAIAALGVGGYLLVDSLRGGDQAGPAPAPKVVIHEQQPEAAAELGFPAFATKNTTRVAGADPVADAAGVALATFPSTGGIEGPDAVTLVNGGDWPSGIAAASLMAPPVRAPILITGAGLGAKPDRGRDGGSGAGAARPTTDGHQILAVGSAAAPSGVRVERVGGGDPAELGAAIDRLRQTLSGHQPQHILLTSSERPQYAMPAAAWAARSGDPVLFVDRDSVPEPTLDALRRHEHIPAYALGPPSAISDKVLERVGKVSSSVTRIGAEDPVQNAIDFARYVNGSFGWNINDPGHGFVIAGDSRPLDAAASAALSASGDWGPLLLTDDPARVPAALRGYLLDLKPGYIADPTRAVYNHVWLIGDQDAISVGFQAQVDDLAEVAQVRSGAGTSLAPQPGPSEQEPATPSKP